MNQKKPNSRKNPGDKVRRPARSFFTKTQEKTTNAKPGEPFMFEDSFRPRRSFPFYTPKEAFHKHLDRKEEKVKPLKKDTFRVIPFG